MVLLTGDYTLGAERGAVVPSDGDRVRVDEANRLRADRPARRLVKNARWLLVRNRDHVSPADQVRLRELLAANRALLTVGDRQAEGQRIYAVRQM